MINVHNNHLSYPYFWLKMKIFYYRPAMTLHKNICQTTVFHVIKGIQYSDAGLVDVYCTQGVEVDALSLRLRASTSTPIVQ